MSPCVHALLCICHMCLLYAAAIHTRILNSTVQTRPRSTNCPCRNACSDACKTQEINTKRRTCFEHLHDRDVSGDEQTHRAKKSIKVWAFASLGFPIARLSRQSITTQQSENTVCLHEFQTRGQCSVFLS